MTTSTVTLRPMRWWDIDPALRLEAVLFGDEAWTAAMFWSELAEEHTRSYVVATDGDDVVGYAGLCVYTKDQAYVQTIGVAPDHQRRGIGTALLVALIDESDRRGCPRLDLEVRADNPTAIGLYERHGFRRIGLRPRYYQPSGTDAIVMRRDGSR